MLPTSIRGDDSVHLSSTNGECAARPELVGTFPAHHLVDPAISREEQPLRTALIFRERVLAPSETFIMEQAKPLRRYQPILVGLRRTSPTLRHMLPEILLRNGDNLIDKFAASAFRKCPISPRFFSRLNSVKPSIVHAHFAVDAIQAMSIAHKLDLPLIVSLHGFDITSTDDALKASFAGRHFVEHKNQLFSRASAFICVSKFLRQTALNVGFPESKVHVHYTGVDCERFQSLGIDRDPNLVLFVGRLVEKKGCEYLLRAMALVQEDNAGARLEIIGDGPLRSSLESLAKELSVRVTFRGTQAPDEVIRSMSRARILCNPSVKASSGDMEGFGMVFAEAQALGTPVVTFAHGAIPEVVSHRSTGLLCPEGDVNALSSALRELLNNQALWAQMNQRARAWIEERFDISIQTEQLEALYDECIARHGHRA